MIGVDLAQGGEVVGVVQGAQGPLDLLVAGVGSRGAGARVAGEAALKLDQATVVLLALDPLAAFEDPGRVVVAAGPLLDHQQLGHRNFRRIRIPSETNSLPR